MAKQHSVDQEMDLIMSNPPSASRNSSFVLTFRILTLLAGLAAIIIGLSLFICLLGFREVIYGKCL